PKASAPARTRELERLVEACDPATAQGLRDRALVLVGYSVAATRAALARLNIDDVRKVDDRRYEIVVSRGENKAPRHVVVPHWGTPRGGRCRDPLCPLCAVFAWTALLRSGGVDHGPLFRPVDKGGNIAGIRPVAGGHDERISVTAVNLILRRLRRRADLPENITPHSLRAGFAMESIEQGAHERDVRRHGGWVANSTAFNVYTRDLLTAEERSSRTVTRPNPLQRIAERRRALPGERTG
ncbi:MAG TPA: tyrosine-type recombinase/integrase, partial [Longimicrobiaceae bacterium]|nr:tyrosine-type recombinase/integrase [Longimicrobiaceae bacterium]